MGLKFFDKQQLYLAKRQTILSKLSKLFASMKPCFLISLTIFPFKFVFILSIFKYAVRLAALYPPKANQNHSRLLSFKIFQIGNSRRNLERFVVIDLLLFFSKNMRQPIQLKSFEIATLTKWSDTGGAPLTCQRNAYGPSVMCLFT